jgi:phosphoribosylformimino-5-aminoimidazole carboxamide ribotide isomerase
MEIIPAIDIINGQCVRLTKGDYSKQQTYSTNPLQVAQQFEAAGIKRLHLVDLDGAKQGKLVNQWVLEEIAINTSLSVDYSGGIKTENDIEQILALGADFISIGSMAVKQPPMVKKWLTKYPGKIILGLDVENREIKINGWQQGTGKNIGELITEYIPHGLQTIICTDISKDGVMEGPSTELYKELMFEYPDLQIIASGGVSCIEDLEELSTMNMYGAITGKAIYEGAIKLEELGKWLNG